MAYRADSWMRIRTLLARARAELSGGSTPSSRSDVADGFLQGTLEEFDVFLDHNEYELGWDTLAEIARRGRATATFWTFLSAAAALMELSGRELEASRRADQAGQTDRQVSPDGSG